MSSRARKRKEGFVDKQAFLFLNLFLFEHLVKKAQNSPSKKKYSTQPRIPGLKGNGSVLD
jgi:hypothetical protein